MRLYSSFVVAFVVGVAGAQTPKNLAEYLGAHPWQPAVNGPMLVLEPDRARKSGEDDGLTSFGRKKVQVGGITVLVPRTMILIDDSLRQEPNMYEGLPTEDKILYLLRSLDDAQWRKVASTGIGLGDLRGEQRLIFDSILPPKFGWRASLVGEDGTWGKEVGKGTLSDQERASVKLKVSRLLELKVNLRDQNAYSWFGTDRYRGQPGNTFYTRDRGDEYVGKSAYGLNIRKEVDNSLKKSQLDYASTSLTQNIQVPTSTTVGAVVNAINGACGLEIIPDFRVANRKINFYGGKATASDLLKALALSVEGTYRKVDNTYVLTSDLVGMGTRKFRLAIWEKALRDETWRRSVEWRSEIGASSGFAHVRFDPNSPVAPTGTLADMVDEADSHGGMAKEISTSELPPALRHYLDQWDKEYTQQPIKKDQVGLQSKYYYSYVMPGGKETQEGELGSRSMFPSVTQRLILDSSMPRELPVVTRGNGKLSFMGGAEDARSATVLIQTLAKFPTKRVWIETHNAEALAAAIKAGKAAGIELGLALRPWRVASNDPDRNIGLEFGSVIADRIGQKSKQGKDHVDFSGRVGTWITPSSPGLNLLWKHYAELASTPGLCGVTLMETQPYGYEPSREQWRSQFDGLDWATLGHGYTEHQRSAFLRVEGVDPIDIGDDTYYTTPDLRQTYFFDDGLRGMPSIYDGSDDTNPKTREVGNKWRTYLAQLNKTAVEQLTGLLGDKPIFIEQRLVNVNSEEVTWKFVAPWQPGSPLPLAGSTLNEILSKPLQDAWNCMALPLSTDGSSVGNVPFFLNAALNEPDKAYGKNLLVDLESIPAKKLNSVLGLWFSVAGH